MSLLPLAEMGLLQVMVGTGNAVRGLSILEECETYGAAAAPSFTPSFF
jgi:hypothetical protein